MPGRTDELIGWLAQATELAGTTDRDLLARFAAGRDEPAFAALVRRHGSVVYGVCRRLTRHAHDAEDAFQATFLILARKADRIDRPDLLGNWLYGTAARVSRKARRVAERRRIREIKAGTAREETATANELTSDLGYVLDEELAALAERYRAAILLCDLQGKPRAEAAGLLGIPEGTLSSRLNAGRKKLAARLMQRGIAPAAGVALAASGGATDAVPPGLTRAAVEAALISGREGIAANVQLLANDGGWIVGKVKLLAATAAVMMAGTGVVVGWAAAQPAGDPPKPVVPEQKPEVTTKAEPKDKPPEPAKKLRMVQRFEMEGSGETPIWSQDGRFLVVPGRYRFDFNVGEYQKGSPIYDTKAGAIRAYLQSHPGDLGEDILGFLPKSDVLVTYAKGGRGQINLDRQLRFWDVLFIGNGAIFEKPTRSLDLDGDVGTPFAILPDGKSVICSVTELGKGQNGAAVIALQTVDIATGEVKTIGPTATSVEGFAVSPDGRQMAILTVNSKSKEIYSKAGADDTADPGGFVSPGGFGRGGRGGVNVNRSEQLTIDIKMLDCLTGREFWNRQFEFNVGVRSYPRIEHRLQYSPDGKWLAVNPQFSGQIGVKEEPFRKDVLMVNTKSLSHMPRFPLNFA